MAGFVRHFENEVDGVAPAVIACRYEVGHEQQRRQPSLCERCLVRPVIAAGKRQVQDLPGILYELPGRPFKIIQAEFVYQPFNVPIVLFELPGVGSLQNQKSGLPL